MKNYKNIIWSILTIMLPAFIFTSCDTGGEDDGTVGNWIMAIVCLLAWLKGGRK